MKPFNKSIMNISFLVSHLKTSNIYVQKQIIRNNLDRLDFFIEHSDFSKLIYQHQQAYINARNKQRNLYKMINLKIKRIEQLSFPFGGFASPN